MFGVGRNRSRRSARSTRRHCRVVAGGTGGRQGYATTACGTTGRALQWTLRRACTEERPRTSRPRSRRARRQPQSMGCLEAGVTALVALMPSNMVRGRCRRCLDRAPRTRPVLLMRGRGVLHAVGGRWGELDQLVQSSMPKPSTRLNSCTLCVTRVSLAARACAAIHRSLAPMIVPDRARCSRISP